MGIVFCLFGTILPDMRAQNSSSSSIDNMSSSMESSQSISSLNINASMNWSTDNVNINRLIEIMQEGMTYLLNSLHLKHFISNLNGA